MPTKVKSTSQWILDLFPLEAPFSAVDQSTGLERELQAWATRQTSSPLGAATLVSEPQGRGCHFRWHLGQMTGVSIYSLALGSGSLMTEVLDIGKYETQIG